MLVIGGEESGEGVEGWGREAGFAGLLALVEDEAEVGGWDEEDDDLERRRRGLVRISRGGLGIGNEAIV